MLTTTSLTLGTFEQSPDQVLANLPLKRNRHLLIRLNQDNKVYAQVLDTKLQIIQEIAEQNIYFGLDRQQGEAVIQSLREIKQSDIQPILHHDKLTLLVKRKRRTEENCVLKIVKNALEALHACCGCFCYCCFCCCCCCPCSALRPSIIPLGPLGDSIGEGVETNPLLLKLDTFFLERLPFVEKEELERELDRADLKLLIKESLEFIEELFKNPTQEIDELQDTLTLIESVCPEDKKQILKNYCEDLGSILKSEEEIKQLKMFLENII